jgi:hypothetical protein
LLALSVFVSFATNDDRRPLAGVVTGRDLPAMAPEAVHRGEAMVQHEAVILRRGDPSPSRPLATVVTI